jgi:hypothetical protein
MSYSATVADAVHQAGIYAGKNSKRCQGSWMNFQFSRALPYHPRAFHPMDPSGPDHLFA